MSIPQSKINICSGVLLTNDYQHTIWFDSQSKQSQYFAEKVVKTFSAYTYLRKEWDIKVDATMEQARTWSYLFFRNGTGKTYYYFINNIQYENENTVTLKLEMDVMQTYLHEYTLHPCFVDREHAATDSIGDNILDEGLELGDYRYQFKYNFDMQDMCVLVLSTFNPETTTKDTTDTVLFSNYHGIFGGLGVYAIHPDWYFLWGDKLNKLDEWGKSDGIISMWMYPRDLIELADGESWTDDKVAKKVKRTKEMSKTYTRNTTISGYIPRNKKLYTYPYNYIYVSNNAGGGAVYHWEKFTDPTACAFRVKGCLSPEASIKMFPIAYNGEVVNYDEGILSGEYPTCAWNQDVYKLWLAQNQHQQGLSMLNAGVSILGGIGTALFTGGVGAAAGLGAAAHGVSSIMNTLAQRKDKSIQPEQAKGGYSSSVNIVAQHQTFSVMCKCVDNQHAKVIDEFFDLYGYKTNRVKVPNRKVRENWTYTKTVGCHVSGNICTEDLRKIQSVYDNGVTFWVAGDNIGNYTLSNECL